LIQTAGRAARHLNGEVILYADVMTDSIKKFLAVTEYRRQKQIAYNAAHGITPRSVSRAVEESLVEREATRDQAAGVLREAGMDVDLTETIKELEEEMLAAANNLEFEKAALLRDQLRELKRAVGGSVPAREAARTRQVSYRRGKSARAARS
jgi:excinuclease ABC subunit B